MVGQAPPYKNYAPLGAAADTPNVTALESRPAATPPTRAGLLVLGAYVLVLLATTHYPKLGGMGEAGRVGFDKLAHLGAYGVLGALLVTFARLPIGGAVLAGAALGALDEWTQTPFGRTCDPLDWAFDVAGTACGAAAVWLARRA